MTCFHEAACLVTIILSMSRPINSSCCSLLSNIGNLLTEAMIDPNEMGQNLFRSRQPFVLQLPVADPVCVCSQGVTFEQVQIEVDDSFKDVYDEVSQPVASFHGQSIFAVKIAFLYRLFLPHWQRKWPFLGPLEMAIPCKPEI